MAIESTNPNDETPEPKVQWRSKKRLKKTRFQKIDYGLVCLCLIQAGLFIPVFLNQYPISTAFFLTVAVQVIFVSFALLFQFSKPPSPEIDIPKKRVKILSERLEKLEDMSWEIRESEDIHRSAAEAFGDIVIHRDAMGELTFSNSVYAKYFDHEIQLPGFQNSSGDDPQKSIVRDIEIATKLGTRWFAWTDLIIRDFETGDSGTRSIGRDITDRKRHELALETKAEEAHQASDAKSRFLGTMSHEIRTPLSGILGMAKLLRDSELSPTQSSHLGAIETSSETLLELIEDLLDQAQVDTGHLVISPSSINLGRLVEDVCELLSDRARQKNIMIASHIDARIADTVQIDGPRLKQVLINLAGNALKFTDAGGVGIELKLKNSPENETPALSFSIKDSGPGIASQDIEKIFNAFAQAESGLDRSHEGAGLGLAISQDIVRLMGGKINVDSEIGKGTTFHFDLPLNPSEVIDIDLDKIDCLILAVPPTPAREALTITSHQYCKKVITANALEKLDVIAATCPENTVVIVDSRFSTSSNWFDDMRNALHPSARIVLLEPAQGSKHGEEENGFDGWLTWPVRAQSFKNTLYNIHTPRAQEPRELEQKALTMAISENSKPMNVLLAEDNPINTLLATTLLGKLGHRVTHAEDGDKAYELFVRAQSVSKFDVVLMDKNMPNCDGFAAIRSIRKYENEMGLAQTPIVVLSADNQESSKAEALEAGADDYLLKPLDFDSVGAILEAHGSPSSPDGLLSLA